ncbi:ATP-dependent helicase [Thraustotheca clavata]|uniref:ATP-dependent helicase n=1 Tax=Thraustotheca clavata TaxID=74557 RepID=A0A1V9YVE2_9STRA|nr:ATP-dependent helicase [Thraustotheca clavata]
MADDTEDELANIILSIAGSPVDRSALFNRVGAFFFRLKSEGISHWWCMGRLPELSCFMLQLMDKREAGNHVDTWVRESWRQLRECTDCVDGYHRMLLCLQSELEAVYTEQSMKVFLQLVVECDVERFKALWNANSIPERAQKLTMGLYELFTQPRLLRDYRFLKPMHLWISNKPDEALNLCDWKVLKKCPGLYMLLVNPDSTLRAWSANIVSKISHIAIPSAKPVILVIEEWMYILENELYNVPMLDMDLHSTRDLTMFMTPQQCIRTPTPLVLWAAFDGVFQSLSDSMIEEILRRYDNLPDLVFNFLQEASPASSKTPQPVVLVVLRCYGALMKRLKFRLWSHTSHDAIAVWEVLYDHFKQANWKEFVLKELLLLFAPFVSSLRPFSQDDTINVSNYFQVRQKVFQTLLEEAPKLYDSQSVIKSRIPQVVLDVLEELFDANQAAGRKAVKEAKETKDGDLPDTETLDIVTLADRYWWPLVLSGAGDERNSSCYTSQWMEMLLTILQTATDLTVVDKAATISALVIRKHIYLIRDTWLMDPKSIPQLEWLSDIITSLCSWTNVDKIPLVVHGALFEAVGISAQLACQPRDPSCMESLELFQDVLCPYVSRITNEITQKGLCNILRIPIVAQHMTLCLLTKHELLRSCIKTLVMHGGAQPGSTFSSYIEPYLNLVSSNMQSFIRSALTILMYQRVHGRQPACMKELLLHWTHVIESLPDVLFRTIVQDREKSGESKTMSLIQFPLRMHVFLMNALEKLSIEENESYAVRLLRFTRFLWRFWLVFHPQRHKSLKYPANRILLPLLKFTYCPNLTIQRRAIDVCQYIVKELDSINHVFDADLEQTLRSRISSESAEIGKFDSAKALAASIITILDTGKALRKSKEIVIENDDDDDEELDEPTPWFVKRSQIILKKKPSQSVGISSQKAKKKTSQVQGGTTSFSRDAAASRPLDSFYDDVDYEAVRKERLKTTTSKHSAVKVKPEKNRAVSVLNYQPAFKGASNLEVDVKTSAITQVDTEKKPPPKPGLPENVLRMLATIRHIRNMRKPLHPSSLYPFYKQILAATQSDPRHKSKKDEKLEKPAISFPSSSDYGLAFYPLLLEEVQSDINECWVNTNGPTIGLRFDTENSREGLRIVTFTFIQRAKKKLFRKNDVLLFKSTLSAEIACTGIFVPDDDNRRLMKKNDQEDIRVAMLAAGDTEMSMALQDTLIIGSEWNVRVIGNLTTSAREYLALMAIDLIPQHLRSVLLKPDKYKSTQSTVLELISDLDTLRDKPSPESDAKLMTYLSTLDELPMKLEDLRVTNIGVIVRKLRKYKGSKEVVATSAAIISKWQKLLDTKDKLTTTPMFLPTPLWEQLRSTYNSSQLQSMHSILNNYSTGVSLLQGPPGTGKTKTIMGIVSGLLAISLPNPSLNTEVRKAIVKPAIDFTSTPSALQVKASSIQQIKNRSLSRQRLDNVISGKAMFKPKQSPTARKVSVIPTHLRGVQTNHILICAPSNGAVDELILRLRTDGLIGADGNVVEVGTPRLLPSPSESPQPITLLRLGSATEDAPEIVKRSCLKEVVKLQVEQHPKTLALQSLEMRFAELKKNINQYHAEGKNKQTPTATKKEMTAWHKELSEVTGKKRRLLEEVQMLEKSTAIALLSKASIIACTLSKCGSGDLDDIPRGFDAVVIDEAAQAVETSTLIPLRERVARVIFVGDPKQLPATVKSVDAQEAMFNRSLFERLADGGVPRAILRVQYRMHPFLREFPSKCFYNGILTDGPVIATRLHTLGMEVYKHPCFQPFVLYDIESNERNASGGSKLNETEAQFGIEMVENLMSSIRLVAKKQWTIGFISPYKEQVNLLRQLVAAKGWRDIEVNTVDGFQGREKDIIIMSCVRTKGIGFLRDIRRLNVALTRARYCCFVLCHVKTLRDDPTWKQLISSAYERKLYIPASTKPFSLIWKESEANETLKSQYTKMHESLLKKCRDESIPNSKRKRSASPSREVKKQEKEEVIK